MEQTLYDVLGMTRDATPAQVKSAFRRKAKASHPDAGGDAEEFQRFKTAYDVLSDPEARRHYDETGELPADREADPAEEALFRSLVGELLVTLIAQAGAPEFTDILREAEDAVAKQIAAVDRQLVELSHLSARSSEVKRRLHTLDEEDLIGGLLQEKLTDFENKIKLTRAFKRRLARLQETLGRYRYDVEIDSLV